MAVSPTRASWGMTRTFQTSSANEGRSRVRTDIQQGIKCWRSRTEITSCLGQRKAGFHHQKAAFLTHTCIQSQKSISSLQKARNMIFFSKLNSEASNISLADSKCQSAFPASRNYHPTKFEKTIVLHFNFYSPAFQLHLKNNL